MTNALTTGFDYDKLDEETAGKLRHYAGRGHKLIQASQVEFIAQMGEILSDARKDLASHDKREGVFVKWATSEFDVSAKTVYNYVNAWDRILCNGYTRYKNLSPTALYRLTSEQPKPAVQSESAVFS